MKINQFFIESFSSPVWEDIIGKRQKEGDPDELFHFKEIFLKDSNKYVEFDRYPIDEDKIQNIARIEDYEMLSNKPQTLEEFREFILANKESFCMPWSSYAYFTMYGSMYVKFFKSQRTICKAIQRSIKGESNGRLEIRYAHLNTCSLWRKKAEIVDMEKISFPKFS